MLLEFGRCKLQNNSGYNDFINTISKCRNPFEFCYSEHLLHQYLKKKIMLKI